MRLSPITDAERVKFPGATHRKIRKEPRRCGFLQAEGEGYAQI